MDLDALKRAKREMMTARPAEHLQTVRALRFATIATGQQRSSTRSRMTAAGKNWRKQSKNSLNPTKWKSLLNANAMTFEYQNKKKTEAIASVFFCLAPAGISPFRARIFSRVLSRPPRTKPRHSPHMRRPHTAVSRA